MVDMLRFLSWNIKGANLAIKRKKLLLYLKQKKVDICFLQETRAGRYMEYTRCIAACSLWDVENDYIMNT